jgi:hypothetical protein
MSGRWREGFHGVRKEHEKIAIVSIGSASVVSVIIFIGEYEEDSQ